MRLKSILLFLAYLLSVSLSGQPAPADPLHRLQAYTDHVTAFNRLFPQEKVYLHFDNTGYFKGETIWFKAYVLRTDSSVYTNLSKVLYVELVNPVGEVLTTCKLPIDSGQAHGNISLNKLEVRNGFHEIRAYTRYMINWDSTGVFSRVFPIFKQPLDSGNYDKKVINTDRYLLRQGATADRGKLKAAFYPEGGSLVKGLESRIAFSLSYENGETTDAEGFLVTESGDTIEAVRTLREGRGIFRCKPQGKQYLCMKDRKGKFTRFLLPQAADTGCVMTLNTLASKYVSAQVSGSPFLQGSVLGLTLMNNGNVLAFDTLTVSSGSIVRMFSRSDLPAGVSQLTLFDRDGRILSERLFFISPDTLHDIERIHITARNRSVSPYSKISLQAKARPRSCFSLSVMDAATQTNGTSHNVATWLLLSSDLKGFIRNPAYYLEADDAEHRLAADLLMLVQGWRRYDWKMMAGKEPFEKKQPIEDKLYLDGQLRPVNKKDDVAGVELSATLFNQEGFSFRGKTVTDKDGYYAFDLPDCNGEWTLLLSTKKDGEAQKYTISINRRFSPPVSPYDYYATQLQQPDTLSFLSFERVQKTDTSSVVLPPTTPKSRTLPTATVVGNKKKHWGDNARASWESEHNGAYQADLYFNCEKAADEIADKGELMPTWEEWLYQKYPSIDEIRKHRSIITILNNTFCHLQCPVQIKVVNKEDFLILRPRRGEEPRFLDECKSIYISLEGNSWENYLRCTTAAIYHPVSIFVYTIPTFWKNVKGLRRTSFQGYNKPHTFQMNNYDLLPPEKDYRRTLYWAPDVKTDKTGNAVIEFWNNSSCEEMILSAESIWNDGTPAMYKME